MVKNLPANAGRYNRHELDPRVGKIRWRRACQPTPVFLPGESQISSTNGPQAWLLASPFAHWTNILATSKGDLATVRGILSFSGSLVSGAAPAELAPLGPHCRHSSIWLSSPYLSGWGLPLVYLHSILWFKARILLCLCWISLTDTHRKPRLTRPFPKFLSYLNIYLLGYGSSWLRDLGFSIFIVACRIFGCGIWDLVPWPGIEPGPLALGALSLNHWSTRRVPRISLSPLFIPFPPGANFLPCVFPRALRSGSVVQGSLYRIQAYALFTVFSLLLCSHTHWSGPRKKAPASFSSLWNSLSWNEFLEWVLLNELPLKAHSRAHMFIWLLP